MSRYIDADALMERFAEMQKVKPDKDGQEYACNFLNMGGEPSAEWFTVEDAVENAPTVDAVPVVRCKDCKHRVVNEHYGKKGYFDLKAFCKLDTGDIFELGRDAAKDDWFCADGERRTDGNKT